MIPDYDSILIATDSNLINRSEFYKCGENALDIGVPMVERAYAVCNDDYVVAGIVGIFLTLAIIIIKSQRLLLYHAKDFFTSKRIFSAEIVNDNSSEVNNVLLLATISALSLSLIFFNHLAEQYSFNTTLGVPYWVFGIGFVGFMCFIYAKAWLYALVNWVFFDRESRRKWISRYFFLTSATAFVFFPLSLIDIFFDNSVNIVIWSTILVSITYELLLFYRLLTNFRSKKYGYLLIFLYFCSVELMPALILWNGLSWASDSIIVKNLLY